MTYHKHNFKVGDLIHIIKYPKDIGIITSIDDPDLERNCVMAYWFYDDPDMDNCVGFQEVHIDHIQALPSWSRDRHHDPK